MMMTKQGGYGCSAVNMVGMVKGLMTVSHPHNQYGESIGENMSPRSVLEPRALSGLAIAINLEEESSHAEHHVVFGRYCCKQNIRIMCAGQEGNSEHTRTLGSFPSGERLTHMIYKEGETVGLRTVGSLYPLLHLNNSETKRGHQDLGMGRSVSRERVFKEAMGYGEQQRHYGERKPSDVCNKGMEVSMSSSPPLQNANKQQPLSRKSTERSYNKERFLGRRSTEESIFYYCNPLSADTLRTVVDDELSCSHTGNFLKVCALCKCRLGVGEDVYMYRGDQAFCSAECRFQRMMADGCMD
ncbi:hypothetical protein L7F22_029371 [Adiantum nelumboides]|nr:hypothetical protein [Adiantum nelumboides]